MKCRICGDNIIIKYITPTKTFITDENNRFKRYDNNIIIEPDGDNPYLQFGCESDFEGHDISTTEVNEWIDKITDLFYANSIYKN